MKCTQCGSQLPENAKFCPRCAHAVTGAGSDHSSVAAHPPYIKPEFAPSTVWIRFTNYILDRIFLYICAFIIGIIISLFGAGEWMDSVSNTLWWIIGSVVGSLLLYVFYFLVFEAILQTTPGKFITRTKVVMRDGSKPPFKNILGRSFARIIPFEPFSFLTGKYPTGWHDSLSKTLVVPKHYTAEDVKKIDIDKLNGSGQNTALIIVFVVVGFFVVLAVIGILSSVVLVSLNTARTKGKNVMIKSTLSAIRPAAEFYYAENGNTYSVSESCYTGMFADPYIAQYLSSIQEHNPHCRASGDNYSISVREVSSSKSADSVYFCVDKNISAERGQVVNYGKDTERCAAMMY